MDNTQPSDEIIYNLRFIFIIKEPVHDTTQGI